MIMIGIHINIFTLTYYHTCYCTVCYYFYLFIVIVRLNIINYIILITLKSVVFYYLILS